MMRSLAVLAINGPDKLPLKDNNAGTIIIKTMKLLKGKIKISKIIPAIISPKIETISEGKVSIIIFPIDSSLSII
jgi:hypothetical protein